MWPIGRQCASGLSLLFVSFRAFLSSAAHGLNGRPSGNPAPISKNVATGGVPGGAGTGVPVVPPPSPRNRIQIPDRSGLPSAVLGVGASRTGLPSAVRGTPGVGYFAHCAESGTDKAVAINPAAIVLFMILWLRCRLFDAAARHQLAEKRRGVFVNVDALPAAAVATGFAQRGVNGRHAAVVLRLQVGAVIDEALHDIIPAPAGRLVERRQTTRVFLRVDVGAGRQEQLQRFDRALLNVLGGVETARVG